MPNANYKIVIDDAVPYAQALFGQIGHVQLKPGKEIQAEDLKDAKALIIRSRTQVNAELLDHSQVEFVGSTVVGLDHVDQPYLQQRGIHFYSAQGCNANSVAEFVINALFEVAEAKGFELQTKTLGIIGVGNVGSRLFNKATTLGMQCLVNDPPKALSEPQAYDYVDLETVLQADIISVHTPLTFDGDFATQDLISAEHLQKISNQQIIINAARGGIINEAAWTKTPTLANIIDCWEDEPNIDPALYQTAFFATPHIAGHSFEAKVAGSQMAYQALCAFLQIAENNDWQQNLPAPQAPVQLKNLDSASDWQAALQAIFRQCHNIWDDHQAIQGENHQETEKKYEFFRRNYPRYHEWHKHKFEANFDNNLTKTLISLGFRSN